MIAYSQKENLFVFLVGYSHFVDLRIIAPFMTIFLSLSDHLVSSLLWLLFDVIFTQRIFSNLHNRQESMYNDHC